MKKLGCLIFIFFGSFAQALPTVMDCEASFGTTLYINIYEEGRAFLSWGHRDFPNYGSLFRNATIVVNPEKDVSRLVFEDGEVVVENALLRHEALSGRALGIYSGGHREFFSCVRAK